MSGPNLADWVENSLHDLVGCVLCLLVCVILMCCRYAEKNMVSYVIALARSAPTPQGLMEKLHSEADIPVNPAIEKFAQDLFNKVPHKSQTLAKKVHELSLLQFLHSLQSTLSKQEKQSLDLLRKGNSYSLLLDEDMSQVLEPEPVAPVVKSEVDKKREAAIKKEENDDKDEDGKGKKRPHIRKRDQKVEEEEEAPSVEPPPKKAKYEGYFAAIYRSKYCAEEEDDYEKDEKEKEAFVERLMQKDKEKTKKLTEKPLTEEQQTEIRKRISAWASIDRETVIPRLRVLSRRAYLAMREPKKLRELKEELEDELYLFSGQDLTSEEQAEYDLKKKLYEIAVQRIATNNTVIEGYQIPDSNSSFTLHFFTIVGEFDDTGKIDQDQQMSLLTARYQATPAEQKPESFLDNADQLEWEKKQISMSTMKFGAEDKTDKPTDYNLVFEDQIEFIKEDILTGKRDLPEAEAAQAIEAESRRSLSDVRKSLPIYQYRSELLAAIKEYQVLIVVGETGSGKTTQIPQYLHEEGYTKRGKVGCTQPRRVAAMSIAKRVSDEMGTKLGSEVGYTIRFEDCTTDRTMLQYMTDGMLLREFLSEPDLKQYSVIMIDEAHERTLHTDILFGLVKDVARGRHDLTLIISSATLDANKFSQYFDGAPIFSIPGRPYPVDIMYTKAPEADYLDAAIVTVLQIHITQPTGDILVFLTGQEEVDAAAEILGMRTKGLGSRVKELIICRIYSTLPSDLQAKIFEPTPPGARKVVLATNIAETSITISGIIYVIDTGFCKQKSYNPRTGMESLIVTPVCNFLICALTQYRYLRLPLCNVLAEQVELHQENASAFTLLGHSVMSWMTTRFLKFNAPIWVTLFFSLSLLV